MTRKQAPRVPRPDDVEQPRTRAEQLEDLLLEASVLLGRIRAQADLIEHLALTRQPRTPYVAHSTREAAGTAYAAHKRDAKVAQAAGFTALPEAPAPGNFGGWATAAEIDLLLRDQLRRLVDAHMRAGVCLLPSVTSPATRGVDGRPHTRVLVDVVREVTWSLPSLPAAERLVRDLQHAVQLGTHLLDGEDKLDLGAPCPHCERRSLVVYLETGVIVCERPKGPDGTRPVCQCNRPICLCREEPRHEHTWLRDTRRHEDSWQALAGRLNVTTLARKDRRS
ncbi:hypothetical protein ACOACO_17575 [Nocardioides sp. CPCC 205120]|uniref:hypothetical protein n=1 Tax=Nocardioides sp. CPCC 205120 TaxID=3406462 RepID=UPI003B5085B7